jgi:hypothetical protein
MKSHEEEHEKCHRRSDTGGGTREVRREVTREGRNEEEHEKRHRRGDTTSEERDGRREVVRGVHSALPRTAPRRVRPLTQIESSHADASGEYEYVALRERGAHALLELADDVRDESEVECTRADGVRECEQHRSVAVAHAPVGGSKHAPIDDLVAGRQNAEGERSRGAGTQGEEAR